MMSFTRLLEYKKGTNSFLSICYILPLVTASLFRQNYMILIDINMFDISKNNYTNYFESFQNNNTTNLS